MHLQIRHIFCPAVVLLCAVIAGCGWQRQLEFPGPGDSLISLWQPWPANGWGLQLQLCQQRECDVVYSVRGDVFLNFAEVYWSNDGTMVGVVTCAEPNLRFAYDRIRKTTIPFAKVAEPMGEHIRHAYSLGAMEDPLSWICSDDASLRFARAHPHFRQR